MPKSPADLLYGTLNLLVLKSLSWKPMHGYAISNWLHERSRGAFDVDDAALYKALHRLEELGAVGSEWGLTENNRKAKYYRLAPAGRRLLKDERTVWNTYALTVSRILKTT
ncbi:MAG: PadR family transcriptional regulator [Gemmatimonadales bacterium]|nr:PadR family transcriptional regulator [Gemmatimonadales bacterium]